ncbi:MAG: HDOD domain-containing protein [Phycisphaerae bacterium]|nr:HDOD domain-containing protein [Phycisphaerae bacterium]
MSPADEIIERIRRDPKIPAPSQTVFKVLELTQDPDCDTRKVAAVISRDGGLTAQLLRQANSALYGFQSPTSSVAEACVRLGLKRVRTAVINQHVVNGLGKACPHGFDAQRQWQAAFATSVAAHDLCRRLLPQSAEDAGTAGLLCDIGAGLMAFGIPERYRAVLDQPLRPPCPDFDKIERRLLGVTHCEVGAAILADWKLEQRIIDAVRLHHADPSSLTDRKPDTFATIVAAAATLSGIALSGSDMDNVAALFAQLETLTPKANALVTDLLDRLVSHIQNTASSYAVELGPIGHMEANFEELMRDLPDVRRSMSYAPMPRDTIS